MIDLSNGAATSIGAVGAPNGAIGALAIAPLQDGGPDPVSAPAALALFGLGLAGLVAARRRS